jgi:large subunit ribosomal protein L21
MVIIEDRGKQYKVKIGDVLKLPKISDCKAKDKIKFDKIIFHKNEKGESIIGTPYVKGIEVSAQVVAQDKDKKIIVFKKKRRHNYRRKIGHRQDLTIVKIENIKLSGKKENKTDSQSDVKENLVTSKGENNGS